MRRNSMLVMAASLILCVSACKPKEEPVAPEDDTWVPDEGREPAAGTPDPAPELSEEEKQTKAKAIYVEAEAKAKADDWPGALLLYEQAYNLVPGKHGFALKVAKAAERTGDCGKAILFFEHFVKYAEPEKYGDDIAAANVSLAALKKQGC